MRLAELLKVADVQMQVFAKFSKTCAKCVLLNVYYIVTLLLGFLDNKIYV